jgi:glycosyltransferase involved in cell wall biosynthesis
MRILHAVLSEGFYGSERHCIELATGQARAGHHVEVLIHNGGSHCGRAFRDEIATTGAAIASARGSGSVRLVVIPHAMPSFLHRPIARWILRRFAPDIVHTHLNPAARRVGRVAQNLGIPHVATLHIRFDHREHADCDGLICGASWQQAAITSDFHGEVAVVWAWLPTAVHAALARVTSQDVARLRRGWDADGQTVVFGSIGRLMPEKGMDVLARAFRLAFPRGDEKARLVILGVGSQESELQLLTGDDPRVSLIGAQPEIAHFYRAFDVYVSASRFEPYGLTILEAMEAGLPLIVTRTDGPREFVADERVSWVEPGEETGLAGALQVALDGGVRRISYDLARFTQKGALGEIEAFYQRVLARKTRVSG